MNGLAAYHSIRVSAKGDSPVKCIPFLQSQREQSRLAIIATAFIKGMRQASKGDLIVYLRLRASTNHFTCQSRARQAKNSPDKLTRYRGGWLWGMQIAIMPILR